MDCAAVHALPRRGRRRGARRQAAQDDRERAGQALRAGQDRPAHLRHGPRDPCRRQEHDQAPDRRAQGRARGRAGRRRGDRGARVAARLAPVSAVPDAAAQPRVVVEPAAARRRPARHVRGLRADLAVRARPGPPVPPAGQLRRAQRVREEPGQAASQRGPARRADGDGRAARRRSGVGVLLHVRRRPAALGLEPRAGDRAAGDRALGEEARPDAGAAAAHPGGLDAVRAVAADRRAGRDRRGRALRAVLVLARPADHQRLRPVARRALRRRPDHRGRARGEAVRRRRPCRSRRGAALRHRRVVAVLARRDHARVRPALPHAAARLPDLALRPHGRARLLHGGVAFHELPDDAARDRAAHARAHAAARRRRCASRCRRSRARPCA